MSLPIFTTQSKDLNLMQTNWASVINPVIDNPINQANILKNIVLINGVTVVNHLLGRMMQGWFVTDINGSATIYRSAPMNAQTLTLTSSAAVTINLGVF